MKRKILKIEKQIVRSKMKDNAVFLNTIEQLTNLYEIYGQEKHEAVYLPSYNRVIFDIGAHIGIWSIKRAILNPESIVYSIEPETENYRLLKKNIKLNQLKNVIPLKLALLDRSGNKKLFLDEFESGQHSLLGKRKKYETVYTTTLDKLVKKIKPPYIDLVKIDTEGAEYLILKGAINSLKKFKPSLIIEVHPWINEKSKKILSILHKLRYSFKIIKNRDIGTIIFAW